MKKNSIILVLFFAACFATAQRQTEKFDYNINGDEAMNDLDYSLAQAFYQRGLSICDPHSIEKLTLIWQIDSSMHTIMYPVMERCLNCLEDDAAQRDTSSMRLLVTYYTQGIGTGQNSARADSWVRKLETIRNPLPVDVTVQNKAKPHREPVKMQFFAGYSATFEAPFGLTVGGMGRTVGWYLRVRSNLSFQDYTEECDGTGIIVGGLNNAMSNPLNVKKSNVFMGTGGIVIKADPSIFISVGAGYCSREVVYKIRKISEINAEPQGDFWAKYNGETSFNGVALDVDGMFKIGNVFYGSLGCSLLNFKYMSANAGIGVFF